MSNFKVIGPAINAYYNLRNCLGYIENGTNDTVTIFQDDATRTFHVRVGNRSYWGNSLIDALNKAAEDQKD